MNRSLTSALLAVTLTLGCGGVAVAQAPKPKPAQVQAVDPWVAIYAAEARKDYDTEVRLLRTLVAKGSAEAQYWLALSYRDGQGVAQDYKEAARLYRLAAAQGYAEAQSNLGVMYENGTGVAQDYLRAHMWFNLAASSLSVEGRKKASTNRDIVAAKMTPTQIAEAQAMARKCQASNFKQCD